jgi:predicted aminopeptidase
MPVQAVGGRIGLAAACSLALLFSGCSTAAYYRQAVAGQWEILRQARPVAAVLRDPATPDQVRRNLELSGRLLDFAKHELRLPVNGDYRRYADLGRPFVVWNVYAAPEFSLEPKTWWYPIVGRLEYRGYFREAAARATAGRWRDEGWEVHVGGVTAYSTLGWLRDPLLNTMLSDSEWELADVLFHELAHQKLFIAGDTDFNEAFATAVAEEGVRRWLRQSGGEAAVREHARIAEQREEFAQLLLRGRSRLERLYATMNLIMPSGHRTAAPPPEDVLIPARLEKARIMAEIEAEYRRWKHEAGAGDEFDGWFEPPLNNARLNTVETYHRLVPEFRRLLAACDGDLEKFYRAARQWGRQHRAQASR